MREMQLVSQKVNDPIDSRAATQTALGFLVGDKVKEKRMKTKVSKMLNINRKRVGRAFINRKSFKKQETILDIYGKENEV